MEDKELREKTEKRIAEIFGNNGIEKPTQKARVIFESYIDPIIAQAREEERQKMAITLNLTDYLREDKEGQKKWMEDTGDKIGNVIRKLTEQEGRAVAEEIKSHYFNNDEELSSGGRGEIGIKAGHLITENIHKTIDKVIKSRYVKRPGAGEGEDE